MKNTDEHRGKEFTEFCSTLGEPTKFNCLFNYSPYVVFTSCENALCYVNDKSESKAMVEWNPDIFENNPDLLQKWNEIALSKMNEAEKEFFEILDRNNTKANTDN